jgi:pimeloyl-ACP methyl ester carboxylesterase
MDSDIPAMRRQVFELRGGRMMGYAWGDPTRPVEILFLHATGFNARTYRTLLEQIGQRFHVLAVDLRGHGRTSLPAHVFGYASWNRHRDDVLELIQDQLRHPVVLAGHSMGGTVSLLAAGKRPDFARGVAMLDPVILPSGVYSFGQLPGAPLINSVLTPISRNAARRRDRFASRGEAAAAFTGRGVFKSFSPAQIEDYLADGLLETPEGDLKLACAPVYEARTFAAQRHDPWIALSRATGPIVALRAERGSTFPQACAERAASLRPEARIAMVPGSNHMLPLDRMDRARAAIEATLVMGRPGGYRDLDLN